jgi:hypothetical protein
VAVGQAGRVEVLEQLAVLGHIREGAPLVEVVEHDCKLLLVDLVLRSLLLHSQGGPLLEDCREARVCGGGRGSAAMHGARCMHARCMHARCIHAWCKQAWCKQARCMHARQQLTCACGLCCSQGDNSRLVVCCLSMLTDDGQLRAKREPLAAAPPVVLLAGRAHDLEVPLIVIGGLLDPGKLLFPRGLERGVVGAARARRWLLPARPGNSADHTSHHFFSGAAPRRAASPPWPALRARPSHAWRYAPGRARPGATRQAKTRRAARAAIRALSAKRPSIMRKHARIAFLQH